MTDWADEVDEVDVSLTEEKLPEPTEIDKGKHAFVSIKNYQYLKVTNASKPRTSGV